MKKITISEIEVFKRPNDMDLGAYVRRKMGNHLSLSNLVGLEITALEPQNNNSFIFKSNNKRIAVSPSCDAVLWMVSSSEKITLPDKITNINYQLFLNESFRNEATLELNIKTNSDSYNVSWTIANFEDCILLVKELF